MKYLKLFESNFGGDSELLQRKELRDFAEGYLVYLLDKGYRVSIPENSAKEMLRMTGAHMIFLLLPPRNRNFEWNSIEDQFVPFLAMLSKSYKLIDVSFGLSQTWGGKRDVYSADRVLSDDFSVVQVPLYYISIRIEAEL